MQAVTEGVKNQNILGDQLQQRIDTFLAGKRRKHSMTRRMLSGLWSFINGCLIGLGTVAVLGFIAALIFPDQAGHVLSWAIHQGVEWARGL